MAMSHTVSVQAAPEIRTLRSFEEINDARERIDAALDAATLYPAREDTLAVYADPGSNEAKAFIRELGILLDTEDFAGYEVIPYCMGTDWLCHGTHTEAFAAMVGDAEEFFRQHMHRYISNVLFSTELLKLIPEESYVQFVRDVLSVSSPANDAWLTSVMDAGMPQSLLAQIILALLRNTHVDLRYSYADFVRYSFARYGSGYEIDTYSRVPTLPFQRVTYWSVLSDEQLFEALDICNQKAPGILFSEAGLLQGLQARFIGRPCDQQDVAAGQQIITDLLVKHADTLTSLSFVNYEVFGMLPAAKQVELVKKFNGGNTVYLVHAAMAALDWELFDKYVASLALQDKDNYAHVIINTQAALHPNGVTPPIDHADHPDERIKLAGHITEILENNARWAGFILGVVRYESGDGFVTDRASGWTYIHDWVSADRTPSRYFAKQGDYVMFRKPRRKETKRGAIKVIFTKIR